MARYVPDRGDTLRVGFHPTEGREQDLTWPALVLSPGPFNARFELVLVAPVTTKVKNHGFEVLFDGCETEGAVLCQQARTIDYVARKARFVEKEPAAVTNDLLAKVSLLVR